MQKGRFSASAEYVLYGSKGVAATGRRSPQNVFSHPFIPVKDRRHLAQKPRDVMKWILGVVPDGATVLDPFCGSGTTLVAARDEGLKAIGIEQDAHSIEAAIDRLGQGVLF